MIAIDTAVLAHAVNRGSPLHVRASAVLEELVNGDRPWALPWTVAHEFLAFVSHPHSVARVLGPAEAWGFLAEVLESPAVRPLAPGARHGAAAAEVLGILAGTGPLPPGFDTAVLLREHGVRELLSPDRAMTRYPFLDVTDPLHGEPWTPGRAPRRRYRVLAPRPRAGTGAGGPA